MPESTPEGHPSTSWFDAVAAEALMKQRWTEAKEMAQRGDEQDGQRTAVLYRSTAKVWGGALPSLQRPPFPRMVYEAHERYLATRSRDKGR